MTWVIINTVTSIGVVLILIYKLSRLAVTFSWIERIGMGMLGAALTMNIAPIVANGSVYNCPVSTPFDNWAAFLLRIGLATYFTGRMMRHFKHKWANERAVDQARAYYQRKSERVGS